MIQENLQKPEVVFQDKVSIGILLGEHQPDSLNLAGDPVELTAYRRNGERINVVRFPQSAFAGSDLITFLSWTRSNFDPSSGYTNLYKKLGDINFGILADWKPLAFPEGEEAVRLLEIHRKFPTFEDVEPELPGLVTALTTNGRIDCERFLKRKGAELRSSWLWHDEIKAKRLVTYGDRSKGNHRRIIHFKFNDLPHTESNLEIRKHVIANNIDTLTPVSVYREIPATYWDPAYTIHNLCNGKVRIYSQNLWAEFHSQANGHFEFVSSDFKIPKEARRPVIVYKTSEGSNKRTLLATSGLAGQEIPIGEDESPILGLTMAVYLSGRKNELPDRLAGRSMGEAQLPLLHSMYRDTILSWDLFQRIDDLIAA